MTRAKFESIEIAKQNGSWTILDEVEELIIPTDLETKFADKPNSREFILNLSESVRKIILAWFFFYQDKIKTNY